MPRLSKRPRPHDEWQRAYSFEDMRRHFGTSFVERAEVTIELLKGSLESLENALDDYRHRGRRTGDECPGEFIEDEIPCTGLPDLVTEYQIRPIEPDEPDDET